MCEREIDYQIWYMMERGHADPCPKPVADSNVVVPVERADICHRESYPSSVVAEKEPFRIVED